MDAVEEGLEAAGIDLGRPLEEDHDLLNDRCILSGERERGSRVERSDVERKGEGGVRATSGIQGDLPARDRGSDSTGRAERRSLILQCSTLGSKVNA